jgi:hypothetical protein
MTFSQKIPISEEDVKPENTEMDGFIAFKYFTAPETATSRKDIIMQNSSV